VRLLLDTHVVYWWFKGRRDELTEDLQALLTHERDVFVSPVTPLELLVKESRGTLGLPKGLIQEIRGPEFRELPIRHLHAVVAGRLPDIHRDPFDRLLIAQAQCEELTLVTRDAAIAKYDVEVMRA
jgi:PIN domain nuclease of toxin-antitoxin system